MPDKPPRTLPPAPQPATQPATQPTLLLTRPAPDSRRFQASLPDMPAVISPILRILPVDHDGSLAHAPGLVFTSAHAVPAAGPGRGRPAYCVGEHTGAAARAAGFEVIAGPGDAARLLPLLAGARVPLVHARGRHIASDLGLPGVVVYDQIAEPLNAQARDLLAGAGPVILPVFSPRSARLLAAALAEVPARAPLWLAAISAAARAGFSAPCACAETAPTPDLAGMRTAVLRLVSAEQS